VIESLQDESSSSSKTEGYNASASIGGDGKVAPGSFGANQNSSSSDSKWVNNQTTLIGGTSSGEMGEGDVNINADSTTITGATVASATRNEDGSLTDNSSSGTGSLNLATDELVINNLQDKDHSESEGFNVSGSSGSTTVGLTSNGHKTEQDTLATLGGGNITKKDGSAHEEGLVESANSDLNNSQVITKDQQTGGLDATVTVDHRLLSGDGLKDIAEDFEDTVDHAEEIGVSVQQVASLDSVGIEDFAGLVNDKAEIRTGVAQIHDQENEEGENELRDVINDSEASAEETQDALSALAQALTGDESQQVDLYNEGENGTENLKGFYDDADGQIALNTQQTDMTDVSDKVEVVGHESYHAKLDQEDSGFSEADREALAHDAGERTSEHWNKENSRDGITTSTGSNADWNKNNQNSNTISFGNASVDGKTADEVEPLLPEFVEDARAAVLDHQEESQQASEGLKGDAIGTVLSIAAAPGDLVVDVADAALTIFDKSTDLIGAIGLLGEDLQQEAVGNITNDITALENAYENKEAIANAILNNLKEFPGKVADLDPAALRTLVTVLGEAAIPAGILAKANKVDVPDTPKVDMAEVDNEIDHSALDDDPVDVEFDAPPPEVVNDSNTASNTSELLVSTQPTRNSVQAELDKLPNGQGSQYTVRQNENGTFSAVRNDASASDPLQVTLEGNLATPIKSTTSPVDQLAINNANGRQFQDQFTDALSHVGAAENKLPTTVMVNGQPVTTIPDLWGRNVGGIVEVKNVIDISATQQLRAQAREAINTGQPMNLVVSPRTTNISQQTLDLIESTGGAVHRFDPATGELTAYN